MVWWMQENFENAKEKDYSTFWFPNAPSAFDVKSITWTSLLCFRKWMCYVETKDLNLFWKRKRQNILEARSLHYPNYFPYFVVRKIFTIDFSVGRTFKIDLENSFDVLFDKTLISLDCILGNEGIKRNKRTKSTVKEIGRMYYLLSVLFSKYFLRFMQKITVSLLYIFLKLA